LSFHVIVVHGDRICQRGNFRSIDSDVLQIRAAGGAGWTSGSCTSQLAKDARDWGPSMVRDIRYMFARTIPCADAGRQCTCEKHTLMQEFARECTAFRIRGTVQRERLKEALATFSMKLATDAVESGVPISTEHTEILDSFISRARLVRPVSAAISMWCFWKIIIVLLLRRWRLVQARCSSRMLLRYQYLQPRTLASMQVLR
jgi:hypothetical protein